MLKHIVMFKMKEEAAGRIEELKKELDALKNKIPEIRGFEVGFNISRSETSYDLVLVSEFRSKEDLEAYRIHPEHQKIIELLSQVCSERRVVDYEI